MLFLALQRHFLQKIYNEDSNKLGNQLFIIFIRVYSTVEKAPFEHCFRD